MASEPTPVVSFANKPMRAMTMDEQKRPVPAYTIEPMKRRAARAWIRRCGSIDGGFEMTHERVERGGIRLRR